MMNWGKWIVVAFVLFTAFIATLVTVCMRQDVSLVSKDYYKEELAYQDQIRRVKNASQLEKKPVIQKAGDFLAVDFDRFNEIDNGSLKLFRPSDAAMDKTFALKPSGEGQQLFSLNNLEKGMYRVRMQWTMHGKEYYIEEIVHL
jgi:hypothetical protein